MMSRQDSVEKVWITSILLGMTVEKTGEKKKVNLKIFGRDSIVRDNIALCKITSGVLVLWYFGAII